MLPLTQCQAEEAQQDFKNPSKTPFQGKWLKLENTVQLTSTKFETLVPGKNRPILTESLLKLG